jgi:hypothetical protein
MGRGRAVFVLKHHWKDRGSAFGLEATEVLRSRFVQMYLLVEVEGPQSRITLCFFKPNTVKDGIA